MSPRRLQRGVLVLVLSAILFLARVADSFAETADVGYFGMACGWVPESVMTVGGLLVSSDEDGGSAGGAGDTAEKSAAGVTGYVAWMAPAIWCGLGRMGWLMFSIILSTLEYAMLPWLLAPGALIDFPLRLLLMFLTPSAGSFASLLVYETGGYAELIVQFVPERLLLLLFRGIVVQMSAPLISRLLVNAVGPTVCGLATPFLRRMVAINPAPLSGTLTVCLEINPDAIIRVAGFEHTSLIMEAAHVEVIIWTTPFCPLWRAGCKVTRLEIIGGTYTTAHALSDDCAKIYPDPDAPEGQEQVPFESLPADWVCSCCEAPKSLFRKFKNKSGEVYWSHVKKSYCTQTLRVNIEMHAVVHPWAGAAVVVPGLPLLPKEYAPPLCSIKLPVVEVMLDKVVDSFPVNDQEKEKETVIFSMGPVTVNVPEATELLNPMELPMVKTVAASVAVENMYCIFREHGYLKSARASDDVIWVGPNIDSGTSLNDKPFMALNVNIVHATSVAVDGHISKLWMRTHFRALRMLAIALLPAAAPPFPADHLHDEQDRHSAALRNAAIDLRLRRLRDQCYNRSQDVTVANLVEELLGDATLHELMVDSELNPSHGYASCETAIASIKAQAEYLHANISHEGTIRCCCSPLWRMIMHHCFCVCVRISWDVPLPPTCRFRIAAVYPSSSTHLAFFISLCTRC